MPHFHYYPLRRPTLSPAARDSNLGWGVGGWGHQWGWSWRDRPPTSPGRAQGPGPREGPGPKGVLAGPGTPRDPKSHLFVTNRVAIQPFCTFAAGFDAELRRGSRQIGPTPPNSMLGIFGQQMVKTKLSLRGWDLSGEIRTEKLISIPAANVQNGWMATPLVTKRCDLGSLGVPGPASTPLGPGPGGMTKP